MVDFRKIAQRFFYLIGIDAQLGSSFETGGGIPIGGTKEGGGGVFVLRIIIFVY